MAYLTRTDAGDFARAKVSQYIRLTPVLWATGLMVPLGMGLCAFLALGRRWREVLQTPVLWAWWSVGSLQAVSVVLNWVGSAHDVAFLAHKLVSSPVLGWFLLGASLAVGRAYNLASPRFIRSVAQLGLMMLIFAVLCVVIFYVAGLESLTVLSPVGLLLPHDIPAVKDFFTMRFFTTEPLGGLQVLRLALFYPWPVMLGFAGIAVFFISLNDDAANWRIFGMTGGFVALAGSESRAAIMAFVIGCIVFQLLKRRIILQAGVALAAFCLLFLILQFIGVTGFNDFLGGLARQVDGMRQDSSDSRRKVYNDELNGFLQSPLIGQGWTSGEVGDDVLPIGTHSTIYGVLYTGGLLTFVPLCIALASTSLAVFTKSGPSENVHRSAVVILLSLIALLYSEGISSFIAPTLFSFWWIGGALRGKRLVTVRPIIGDYAVAGRFRSEQV